MSRRVLPIAVLALAVIVAIWFVVALNRPRVTFQINTTAPGFSAHDVKAQITVPIEVCLAGLPGAESVWVASEPELSIVLITLNGRIDPERARQEINARLQQLDVPPGCSNPQFVPISTEGMRMEKSAAYR